MGWLGGSGDQHGALLPLELSSGVVAHPLPLSEARGLNDAGAPPVLEMSKMRKLVAPFADSSVSTKACPREETASIEAPNPLIYQSLFLCNFP
ncbi:unnamed protein product [Linum trigynum]|uniref:Uncharacterized protein n=1 Tax=Linum trigynum TaxID=586398 RepID=A0AAV2F9F9_9ROSI